MVHRLSCSSICGIFLDQGSNLCLLHWQADFLPLSHQQSRTHRILYNWWCNNDCLSNLYKICSFRKFENAINCLFKQIPSSLSLNPWYSLGVEGELLFWGALAALTEKAMAPHSSTLAWKIPWTEEPGRLQSMGSPGVGDDWVTSLSLFTFMHWRRKWQPTPVFLPGESQGWGSLVGCRLWCRKELDTTEWLSSSSSSSCLKLVGCFILQHSQP